MASFIIIVIIILVLSRSKLLFNIGRQPLSRTESEGLFASLDYTKHNVWDVAMSCQTPSYKFRIWKSLHKCYYTCTSSAGTLSAYTVEKTMGVKTE